MAERLRSRRRHPFFGRSVARGAIVDARKVEEARPLFTTRPEAFATARREVVEALRADGRDPEADAVASLRRPSRAAWALNLLAASDPGGIAELLRLDEAARRGQVEAITAGAPGTLRARGGDRRRVVTTLAHRASRLLVAGGVGGESHLGAIEQLLEAAVDDAVLAERVRNGTLDGSSTPSRPPAGPVLVAPPHADGTVGDHAGAADAEAGPDADRSSQAVRCDVDRGEALLHELAARVEAAEEAARTAGCAVEEARRSYDRAKAAARRADLELRRRRRERDRVRTRVRRAAEAAPRLESRRGRNVTPK